MAHLPRLVPPLLLSLLACTGGALDDGSRLAESRSAASLESGWVGSWAVAPHADGTNFGDETLRQIVHTSVGGGSLRVRLSNVFGKQPLSIDNVHVAARASGSSIVPSSDKLVPFAGQSSATIAAGQSLLSDAVAFTVEPLADLAISFHVAGAPGGTTAHGTALQDNYVAPGNVAGSESLNGAQVKGSYYFLTNVDVQSPAAWGAVVTLGASITDGVASGANHNRRWPNDLAKRLSDAQQPVAVLNQGISGNRLLADGNGESALKRFDRDVLSQAGVRWVIFSDDPINDLGNANPPSSAQLIDGLKQLIQKAHAANIEFWCSTLTPYQGSAGWKPEGETARAALIAFIEQPDSGCDQIVDQDGATHDPSKPTWFLPADDAGDHLHPNETGLQAIADAVPIAAFTAPLGMGGGGGDGGLAGGGGMAGAATAGSAGTAGAAATGGTGGAAVPSAGAGGSGAAAAGASGGASSSAGSAPTAGATFGDAPQGRAASSDGCSCASPDPSDSAATHLAALLTLMAGVTYRRKRRRSHVCV